MKFALIYAIEILAMGALAYWSVRDKRTGWTPLQALWIQGPALVGTICVTFFWQLHSTDENNNWEQFALLLAILAYVVYVRNLSQQMRGQFSVKLKEMRELKARRNQ